jgi:uncharacterized protein (TIGR02231 family)
VTPVASVVAEVTVYADRALVTRRAEAAIAAGETTLVFTDLPTATDPASLQVGGKGAFTLRDVRLVTRQRTRDVSAQLRALEDERRGFEDRLAAENDRIREADAERLFLAEMVKRLTSNAGASESLPLDPAAWAKMLDFQRARNEAVNAALRASRRAAQALQAEIERVNREIKALGPGSRLSVMEAEVVVEAKAAVTARLDLSYIVTGPSWRPDYVLRADSEGGRLSVHYRAMVRQNTGEAWKDATLRLSTARPQVGGALPELSPWTIDVYKPAPVYREAAKSSRAMAPPAPSASLAGAADAMAEAAEPAPDMEYASSVAESGATAVTFSIPGSSTVDSDNRDRTVTVAVLELPVAYSYAAVPKLSPYAYFRAEATNDSDFPLLPGVSHIYVDGAYVADAAMAAVPPSGTFRADLGIDESVTVERKLKRKFDESSGLVAKKSKTTWEYLITVKNGKRRAITLSVSDQMPVSANEQIVVKALEPAYAKDTEALKKTEFETYVWTLSLAPGKEAVLPLSFSVEYPKGTPIIGLE